MSNYTKATDFTAKDSLSSGDPNKIVSGAEIDTEFDAIATAVATKANSASPTFTGTLTFASFKGASGATVTTILDEDTMATDSATALATQQSIKAYVDTQLATQDALSEVLATGNTTGANNIVVTAGQSLTADNIAETTAASGVTIDSVLLKDGGITLASGVAVSSILDEDTMTSNSATALATQQSIKAYTDTQIAAIATETLAATLTAGNSTSGTNIVVTAGDSITTNTIAETTAASGVTVDGLLIKDSSVFVGGTAAANQLDDYEEGTFTFAIEDTSSNALTSSNTTGYYTKVGRLVHFSLRIAITSLGAATTNACRVTGLPFTIGSAANSPEFGNAVCGFASGLAITAGQNVVGDLAESTTNMNLYLWDDAGGPTGLTANEISADGVLQMSGTYWTSA